MIRCVGFRAMELLCEVQTYEWGKLGLLSEVAWIAQSNNYNFKVKDDTPYAELWMGTHPNAPSKLKESGATLKSWISENADSLGVSKQMFGTDLSFLFKVLSINKALSIQAHPAKDHAERLHKEKPNVYKDPNHKPEMAIALTPFEVLIGFRPYDEIKNFFKAVPELRSLVNEKNATEFINSTQNPSLLKSCFGAMMQQTDLEVTKAVGDLLKRLDSSEEKTKEFQLYNLVKRLNSQFENDVGIFGVYFFNYVKLEPGNAVYLGANFPHAYLSGDCVECMACSDNVVRAGLTPKLKDVETLIAMLDYKGYNEKELLLNGKMLDKCSIVYNPPIADFSLISINIPCGIEYELPRRQSASILLVLKGCGKSKDGMILKKGSVIFLPARITLNITCSDTEDIVAYMATTNDDLVLGS